MNATTIQNVVTYNTTIAFDNPDLRLFPGMTAYASIPVATANNVVKIPNGALRFKPDLTDSERKALYAKYNITDNARGNGRRAHRRRWQSSRWRRGQGAAASPAPDWCRQAGGRRQAGKAVRAAGRRTARGQGGGGNGAGGGGGQNGGRGAAQAANARTRALSGSCFQTRLSSPCKWGSA